ncbi:DUF1289 domain-containing protein [Microbulbifer bruguierae]|uniref:DUF1289 domain-containing protein n=1 Tax=Microbulbifer bruguierae TaxID=3029061 RepID=UPI003898F990
MWHKTEEQKLISACIHACNLIEDSKICGGCFRTTGEIEAWRKLDEAARKIILQKAEMRKLSSQGIPEL